MNSPVRRQLLGVKKFVVRALLLLLPLYCSTWAQPLVLPYLQNLTESSVDIYWVSSNSEPVKVTWLNRTTHSRSTAAPELSYHPVEQEEFPALGHTKKRYLHRATLDGLERDRAVSYVVHFPDLKFEREFQSQASENRTVRLIAYADSETEPESTGKPAKWGTPETPQRRYLIDQTEGYKAQIALIKERAPNAILIAGDLVESGGEQRDWDQFWKHNKNVAGSIPIWAAPGNHEYYAGPKHGGYGKKASRWAIDKYRTYFHPKGSAKARHYYTQDFGPAILISLDSGDGLPHGTSKDTNHHLPGGTEFTCDYNPGSAQYLWLETQLRKAQQTGKFLIVMFHHCPYSSGGHGRPPGPKNDVTDPQSGQPLRALTPLLFRYGVDLVLTGHDEMFERSELSGTQTRPDGTKTPHTLQVYDVGVGGDGLRSPDRENEWSQFLAYRDSQEQWENGELVGGGRHYGHLEIDVVPTGEGWKARLSPVYILPIRTSEGWSFQRKLYNDPLIIESKKD